MRLPEDMLTSEKSAGAVSYPVRKVHKAADMKSVAAASMTHLVDVCLLLIVEILRTTFIACRGRLLRSDDFS